MIASASAMVLPLLDWVVRLLVSDVSSEIECLFGRVYMLVGLIFFLNFFGWGVGGEYFLREQDDGVVDGIAQEYLEICGTTTLTVAKVQCGHVELWD